MSLVLRDSTEIAQKSILFITPDVLNDRHYVHTGSWSGTATLVRVHHFQIAKRYRLHVTSAVYTDRINSSDNSDRIGFFRFYQIRSVIGITVPILKQTSLGESGPKWDRKIILLITDEILKL